jgi:hypothetical protein
MRGLTCVKRENVISTSTKSFEETTIWLIKLANNQIARVVVCLINAINNLIHLHHRYFRMITNL